MGVHSLVVQCPWCGKANNGHANIDFQDASRPSPGSASMCASCHGVGVFEAARVGLVLRKPTRQEGADLLRDEDFRAAMRRAVAVRPLGGVRVGGV